MQLQFKAVIFDLDGVICNTDEFHFKAWKQIADELGISFSRKDNDQLRGISRNESLEIILTRYPGSPLSTAEKHALTEKKNMIYKKYLVGMTSDNLTPGIRTVIDFLKGKNLKTAIGSSSKNAKLILSRLGVEDLFDVITDGNGIHRSKPAPDVFLITAKRLQTLPEACLVVEDSESGAHAAHAANMEVACVGAAAKAGAGDYNIRDIADIRKIVIRQ
jgi:beta-phosphoglucomutase